MNSWTKLNKNQSGQAALEAAIILIAFVVVASVFAFAVLSAGTASTQRGEASIYSGLKQVESSMAIKGSVMADLNDGTTTPAATVQHIIFKVASVSGGSPVPLDDVTFGTAPTKPAVIIAYRDGSQTVQSLGYSVTYVVEIGASDGMLADGELAEVKVNLSDLTTALDVNTPFSLELKPPTGGVLQINRTTPAALQNVMELR